MILILDNKICSMKYYYLVLLDKERIGHVKGFLKVTAVIALLQSGRYWQMHMSWNVYTCQMNINRDMQHISLTDCEQSSC